MSFHVDVSGLKDLAKVCRKVAPDIEKELKRGLRAGAEVVAVEARRNADSFPRKGGGTHRIAGSVYVRQRGLVVKVGAGGDGAPEAAVMEHRGRPGQFRHPVFGNREKWVSQEAHPFLTPAGESEAAFGVVLAAMDSALRGISVV